MGVLAQFKTFLLKQNALALAIGVIIGGAIGKVVSGIVEDIFMPIIGIVLPGGEWRNAQLTLNAGNAFKYGDLLGRVIDFIIVSAVVFVIVRFFLREKIEAPAPPPPTKICPECLEAIPVAARRCRACTQVVA